MAFDLAVLAFEVYEVNLPNQCMCCLLKYSTHNSSLDLKT